MYKMKDSGIKWLGKIPEHWEISRIKNHFINKKQIAGIKSVNYERLALTLNGVVKRSKEDSNGLQPADFNTYQIIEKDNLIFKLIDLQNISTSRVGLSPYTGLVSPAYIRLEVNKDTCPRFSEFFFLMMWYNQIFNNLGDNGVRSSLNATELINVSISLPPLKEQQKIADFLDEKCTEIDELAKDIKAQIEILEEYKKSVITEQFNGTDLWKIKNIGSFQNGADFTPSIDGYEVKFLGVGDFKNNMILDNKNKFSTVQIDRTISSNELLKSGDIIFVRSNGSKDLVGRSIMVENIDFPIIYSGFCIRFRNNKKEILSKYLLYYFRSHFFKKALFEGSMGTAINNLSQPILGNIKCPIVSKKEQQKIIDYLDIKCTEIDSTITEKKEQLKILEQYKKSLIYEYVTGKKEVI
ncbi:restriction endonuclease subunit S [Clostridium perfringens]|uniref:restriction endonuclease subunit S n=1 Tax=Clostridium perfringens TaxID=1502 RepID=UPI002245A57E|nr:restriction endonuclease subunit S [Clostridium perfringens]MCX0398503.1 restriction endonuclease subunit S [Clostridium perfringens]